MPAPRFDCSDPAQRQEGIRAAAAAVRRGALVVFPTDSAYAVACDAFNSIGTAALRSAKQRPTDAPLPVLVANPGVIDALVYGMTETGRQLVAAFWPGPLTLVARQQPSLSWDVDGSTKVSVRMPLHPVALELLGLTGPLAATGANTVGEPAPRDCDAAIAQLGDAVAIYLDAGPLTTDRTSAVVDVTGNPPTLLRRGSVPEQHLLRICADLAIPAERDVSP